MGRLRVRPNEKRGPAAKSVAVTAKTRAQTFLPNFREKKLVPNRTNEHVTDLRKAYLYFQESFPNKSLFKGACRFCTTLLGKGLKPGPARNGGLRPGSPDSHLAHPTHPPHPDSAQTPAGRGPSLPSSSSGASQHLPTKRTSCRPKARWLWSESLSQHSH